MEVLEGTDGHYSKINSHNFKTSPVVCQETFFRKCEACIEGGWQRFPVVVSTSDTLGSVTNGLALLALVHLMNNKVILSFIQNTTRLC